MKIGIYMQAPSEREAIEHATACVLLSAIAAATGLRLLIPAVLIYCFAAQYVRLAVWRDDSNNDGSHS